MVLCWSWQSEPVKCEGESSSTTSFLPAWLRAPLLASCWLELAACTACAELLRVHLSRARAQEPTLSTSLPSSSRPHLSPPCALALASQPTANHRQVDYEPAGSADAALCCHERRGEAPNRRPSPRLPLVRIVQLERPRPGYPACMPTLFGYTAVAHALHRAPGGVARPLARAHGVLSLLRGSLLLRRLHLQGLLSSSMQHVDPRFCRSSTGRLQAFAATVSARRRARWRAAERDGCLALSMTERAPSRALESQKSTQSRTARKERASAA